MSTTERAAARQTLPARYYTDPAIFDLLDDAARIYKNQLVILQEQIDAVP